MHLTLKKRDHGFEREQGGGTYGRAWREEREGGKDVIIILKVKEII